MLVELFLAGLCLNSTCLDEEITDSISLRKQKLERMAAEIKGQHLYVTTIINDRLSGINATGGTGIAFDLFNILRKKFGFNYTVVWPNPNIYGNTKEGVIKMLVNGQVNLSVAFMPVISQLRDKVHYSPSLDVGEWVVLMKRPSESATGTGLLAPFTLPVWCFIMVSLFLIGPIIYVMVYFRTKYCTDDEQHYSFLLCFWFVYGALLKQGSNLSPVADSTRMLFATWWIFITVLTAFYTANLTAFLTLSEFSLPITAPDNIGRGRWKWITNQGNVIEEVIKMGNTVGNGKENDEYRETVKNLGPRSTIRNASDENIMETYVIKQDMMFIREKPIADYDIYDAYKKKVKDGTPENSRCTYVLTKFSVFSSSRAFAYSRQFKYYELFNDALQHLVEAGVIKFKMNEELPHMKLCPIQLQSQDRKLKNNDLMLTYVIVGVGFVVSISTFIWEMVYTTYYRKPKPDNNISYGHTLRGGVMPIYRGNLGKNAINFQKNTTTPLPYTFHHAECGKWGKEKNDQRERVLGHRRTPNWYKAYPSKGTICYAIPVYKLRKYN